MDFLFLLLLLVLLLSTLLFLTTSWLWRSCSSPLTLPLPPHPPSLPVLGNLLLLPRILTTNLSLLQRLTSTYGPIFTLWLGPIPSIYITRADIAHEALILKGSFFASRPILPSRALFTANFRNISAAPYGGYWRSLRRNLVTQMLGSAKIRALKPTRHSIIESLLQRFRNQAQSNSGLVTVYANCRIAMFELMLLMCFGVHLDESVIVKVADFVDILQSRKFTALSDLFPFMRFFDLRKTRKQQGIRQKQVEIFGSLIDQHKKLKVVSEVTPGSYLDTLLNIQPSGEEKGEFTTEELVTLCSEFIVGGVDTTVNCLEWAMANLVIHQDIQTKLYAEIQQAVGKRPVEEDDVENMPYLQAVIKEALRIHPPGHFTLPHAVTQACQLAGYHIPTNAIINFHIVSINRDPDVWPEPMKFKPERFLSREVDLTGSREVTMIPFSAGRRVCPGAGLAMMHVGLFVARMVQAFKWTTSKPGMEVDLSEALKFTIVMKTPLEASIKERS